MSSAKAQLESDTRVLAFELGKGHNLRINSISAGALKSRAASAIGGGACRTHHTARANPRTTTLHRSVSLAAAAAVAM